MDHTQHYGAGGEGWIRLIRLQIGIILVLKLSGNELPGYTKCREIRD